MPLAIPNTELDCGWLDRPWLDFLWMEITARCNLQCVHCYADSSPNRPLYDYMQIQHWLGVLDQASSLGCRSVQFIGGEPTIHPNLPTMIEHARACHFELVEVYTNGTLFTDRLKEVFLRNKVELAFSVYGATPETHETVTEHRGSFNRTIDSIRWAVESGLTVRVGITQTTVNTNELDSLQELLRGLGVAKISIDRIRGVGRGMKERDPDSAFGELCGACWRGKLVVTPTGQIFPCVFSRFCVVGHVEQGLSAVLASPLLRSFRHSVWDTERSKIRTKPQTCCAPEFENPSFY